MRPLNFNEMCMVSGGKSTETGSIIPGVQTGASVIDYTGEWTAEHSGSNSSGGDFGGGGATGHYVLIPNGGTLDSNPVHGELGVADGKYYKFDSFISLNGEQIAHWLTISADEFINSFNAMRADINANTLSFGVSQGSIGFGQGPDPFGGNTDLYFTMSGGLNLGTEIPLNYTVSSTSYTTFSSSYTYNLGPLTAQNGITQFSDLNTWTSGDYANGYYHGVWTNGGAPTYGLQVNPSLGATVDVTVNVSDGGRYMFLPFLPAYTNFVNNAVNNAVADSLDPN